MTHVGVRCLQEITYLTSPQAMNPLPNRPLLNNSSLPLQMPTVPTFDSVPFNGRPRKMMPEGKDYPILSGMTMISGPPSAAASTASQGNPLDRAGILGSAVLQSQQPQIGGPLGPQVQLQPLEQPTEGKETESEAQQDQSSAQQNQLTAIFRDENGDWREKLREAAELARAGQVGQNVSGAASWEQRSQADEEEAVKPTEEADVEEEEGTEIGEGESGKIWKPKRTLRKSVSIS